MKAGFIGLGNLGKVIAKRLVDEGVELTVWNRTREKTDGLGAMVAETPFDVIRQVEVVMLNVFDSNSVRSILNGPHGVLSGDCRNRVVIDMTTNHFQEAERFHALLKEHDAKYLEAPVIGSATPASQGNLTVLASGEKETFDRALPYLRKIGRNIFYLGAPGLASKMKLVNNSVLASFMVAIAEAVSLGEAIGLDRGNVLDILSVGAANSTVFNGKKEKLLHEDFSPQFTSVAIYKDLHYLQDLCRSLKKPLFTGSVAKELFALTFAQGIEESDFSAVYKVFRGKEQSA